MNNNVLRRSGPASVTKYSQAAQARRSAIADEFRKRLQSELAANGNTTLGQEVLVAMAVSQWVELSQGNAAFLRGTATPQTLARMGLLRSQLLRTMRALGLVNSATDPQDGPDGPTGAAKYETMEEVVAHFGASPMPQEAADGASESD